jgi:hypothetical protein
MKAAKKTAKRTSRTLSGPARVRAPKERTILVHQDSGGMPAAFPDRAVIAPGGRLTFEAVGDTPFRLVFRESPTEHGDLDFPSAQSGGRHCLGFQVRRRGQTRPYKYSVIIGNRETDPEIIVEPWR